MIEPASVMAGLFAHTEAFGPASTVGAGVIVITLLLDTALQLPLPVEVSVNVTVPAATSAALAVYVALNVVAFGLNEPVPPLHVPPVAPVTLPLKAACGSLAQTETAAPALTTGAGVKDNKT